MKVETLQDAKRASGNLRKGLKKRGLVIAESDALDLLAEMCGAKSWHVISARLKKPALPTWLLCKPEPACYLSELSSGSDDASFLAVPFDVKALKMIAQQALLCRRKGLAGVETLVTTSWLTAAPEQFAEQLEDAIAAAERWLKLPLAAYDVVKADDANVVYVNDTVRIDQTSLRFVAWEKHCDDELESEWLELDDIIPKLTITSDALKDVIEQQGCFKAGAIEISVPTSASGSSKGWYQVKEAGKLLEPYCSLDRAQMTLRLYLMENLPS